MIYYHIFSFISFHLFVHSLCFLIVETWERESHYLGLGSRKIRCYSFILCTLLVFLSHPHSHNNFFYFLINNFVFDMSNNFDLAFMWFVIVLCCLFVCLEMISWGITIVVYSLLLIFCPITVRHIISLRALQSLEFRPFLFYFTNFFWCIQTC